MEATLYAKILALLISSATQVRQPSPVQSMEQFTNKDGTTYIIIHKPTKCFYGDGTETTCTGK